MQIKKIAVVGGGVAGVSAAWLLQRNYDVTLFERNDYIGGHTHTHQLMGSNGPLAVDSGFIVYNAPNYPNLVKLFDWLDVDTRAGDMSFAASLDNGAVEYAGSNLATLFAQPSNLVSPAHWRMLRDIMRFNRDAYAALDCGLDPDLTLGDFLDRHGYADELATRYLLPMAAAIWSCPASEMRDYPAHSLLQFFANHGLINIVDRPSWRTVVGGSQQYMRKMLDSFRGKVLRTSPIEQITRDGRGWRLHGADQPLGRFDAVVLACHADQAAAMLSDQLHPAEALLNCFRYQPNRAVLHNDTALMPKRRSVWSSWNYLSESHGEDTQLSVTYWMNRLQGIEDEREWLVTLNPLREPDPAKVHAEMDYEHPVFDRAALRAQSMLPRVQGDSNLWLCGSYHGYGFHEDALSSAVRVAEDLGVTAPWSLMPSPAASNSREPAAVC